VPIVGLPTSLFFFGDDIMLFKLLLLVVPSESSLVWFGEVLFLPAVAVADVREGIGGGEEDGNRNCSAVPSACGNELWGL
jgi:hypothetical protein